MSTEYTDLNIWILIVVQIYEMIDLNCIIITVIASKAHISFEGCL